MTYNEAKLVVLRELNRGRGGSEDELVLLEDKTIERSYGWIFYYNTRKFVETNNFIYALGGNGPVVVESETGRVTRLGTARASDEEIADFERRNGLRR